MRYPITLIWAFVMMLLIGGTVLLVGLLTVVLLVTGILEQLARALGAPGLLWEVVAVAAVGFPIYGAVAILAAFGLLRRSWRFWRLAVAVVIVGFVAVIWVVQPPEWGIDRPLVASILGLALLGLVAPPTRSALASGEN